ncbi:Crp/Fnr family transcriptional regulator [Echinicola sediminis]
MNHFTFISYLTSNGDIDEDFTKQILGQCRPLEVKKGAFLLQKGGRIQFSFFVEKGLLKQFSLDGKGKEHILQFAPENWFVSDRESEYLGKPSSYYIEAIEDSVVLQINQDLILSLSKKDPNFIKYNYGILHHHISSLQKRITLLQSASAEERYLDFIKTYPDILLRVPQVMVASFLGITAESLSRVRKVLAEKNFNKKAS